MTENEDVTPISKTQSLPSQSKLNANIESANQNLNLRQRGKKPTPLTVNLLRAKAHNYCSYPGCDVHFLQNATLIGEVCHIVGDSLHGPRGNDPLPLEQRHEIDNLILLCNNHHQEIDAIANQKIFSVEVLRNMKSNHENKMASLRATEKQTTKNHPKIRILIGFHNISLAGTAFNVKLVNTQERMILIESAILNINSNKIEFAKLYPYRAMIDGRPLVLEDSKPKELWFYLGEYLKSGGTPLDAVDVELHDTLGDIYHEDISQSVKDHIIETWNADNWK